MYQSEDLYTEDLPDESNEMNYVEEGDDDDNENDDENNEGDNQRKVIKPKRVLNPRPKLDATLLTGPKGLSAINGYFKNIKYKGKGHEDEDLNVIMKIYEHWSHRLFPKLPFDDCLRKIEVLGNKRAVIAHINRMRMHLDDEGKIEDDHEAMEDHQPLANENQSITESLQEPVGLTDEQRELIKRKQEQAKALRMQKLKEAQEKAFRMLNSQQSTAVDDTDFQSSTQVEMEEMSSTSFTKPSQSEDVQETLNGDQEMFSQLSAETNNKNIEREVEDSNEPEEHLEMEELLDEMEIQVEKTTSQEVHANIIEDKSNVNDETVIENDSVDSNC